MTLRELFTRIARRAADLVRHLTASELIAIGTVAGVIVAAVITGQAIFSPGKLSAMSNGTERNGVTSHAELARDCGACHAAPWSSDNMGERCLTCHVEVIEQLQNPHELHSRVTVVGEGYNCVQNCHTEHRGPEAALTLLTEEHFTRDQRGFSLEAHQTRDDGFPFSCTDCHEGALDQFTETTCVACHQDRSPDFMAVHLSDFGTGCLTCHDGLDTYGSNFDHNTQPFPLAGRHTLLPCADCHEGATTVEQLQATPRACINCHGPDDIHLGQAGEDCGRCHTPDAWLAVDFDHGVTSYPLTGRHASVTCTLCHPNNRFANTPTECNACHAQDDQHAGSVPDCQECHVTSDWRQVFFDHTSTTYALTGKHVAVDCVSCHPDAVFATTPKDCFTCHKTEEPHQGTALECTSCHTTDDWRRLTFDHTTTDYPLTGKHGSLTCLDCHPENTFINTPTDCATCHEADDPHAGSGPICETCHTPADWHQVNFDHATTSFLLVGRHASTNCNDCHIGSNFSGAPTDCYSCHQADDNHNGELGTECRLCHNSVDWTQIIFDHQASIFPLTGAHASAPCAACHAGGQYRNVPTDCYSCHATDDAHAGAYGADCARCHSTAAWLPSTFNHNTTGLPLTGAHAALACTACHAAGTFSGLSAGCYSCHAASDVHDGANGQNCARCHSTSAWLPPVVDHATTAFPLTGAHANLACNLCHVNGVYTGTPTNCYACHAADDVHAGANGQRCQTCHTTTAWLPPNIDHNQSAFPLTGAHVSLACNLCHVNGVYAGTPTNCYACHAANDVHNGANGQNCQTCHSTTAWLPPTINHNQSAFPLTGAHANLACNVCHVNGVYAGTPTNCYACHAANDVHNGANGQNCQACHSTTAWLPATVDHNTTAFPLTGAHANLACNLCHANGVYAGTPTNCYACHAQDDAHNGVNGTDCSVCHSTTAWLPAEYNGPHTFPLNHHGADGECAQCHTTSLQTYTCYAGCHHHTESRESSNHRNVNGFGNDCARCHPDGRT